MPDRRIDCIEPADRPQNTTAPCRPPDLPPRAQAAPPAKLAAGRIDADPARGGSGAQCTAAAIDEAMAAAIAQPDRAHPDLGARLLGYDFLVDDDGRRVVSEINANSIGGIVRVGELDGTARFVDWLHRIATRGSLGACGDGLD